MPEIFIPDSDLPEEDPSRSPLVTALQKAVKDLQDEAESAHKSARWRTFWMVVLGLVCVALAVVGAIAVAGLRQSDAVARQSQAIARQAQATTQQVEQGSLNSCLDGNAYRAGTVLAIDRLVTLLVNGSKDPATLKAARDYEAYVLSVNAPRNCYVVYHVKPPAPGSTASAPSAGALP
jgi:hypothetical protein